ncbi:MAG: hypothetical protein IKQ16_02340 [Lentisphaeria bacterium]|nr:hypothetical protein [Lentisphaeria bacterium]
MKRYTIDGVTTDKKPGILRLADGSSISPVTDAIFVQFGGTIEEDDEPTHMDLLNAACDDFVDVCNDIGEFIGDPDFQGGIDEIDALYQCDATQLNPNQALILAARWEGADKKCNHWANKDDVGLSSPAWWWYCWARYASRLEAEAENTNE